jgi:hypothetical protein
MVAYNVQSAVDTEHHLIVAHEMTNVGTDRSQLAYMGQAAKAALHTDNLDAVADRGYLRRWAGLSLTVTKTVDLCDVYSHCRNTGTAAR